MSEEKSGFTRKDFLLVALAISLIAHVATMIYMRPQIMTRIAPGFGRAARHRGPMEMTEAPPPAENVRLEVVKDADALKDSPGAVLDEPAPVASPAASAFLENSESAPTVPDEVGPQLVVPVEEVAPKLAEQFHVSDTDSFMTPISQGEIILPEAKPVAASPLVAPGEMDVPLPDLTPPEPAAAPEIAEVPVHDEAPIEKTEEFKPTAEVLDTVDEKVVEAEKSAVRDLLDVKDAKELSKYVKVDAKSASEGEWTYFSLDVTPGSELGVVPKDVVVLLDASGSIGRDRLTSCRAASQRILRSCTNTGDRFNLVAFRDKFSYAFKEWAVCDQPHFDHADRWLSKLAAHGRTDVFATIRSVLTLPRDPKRPLVAIVVTDGDANSGVSSTAEILSKFAKLNDGLISVYMYGVKASANRELIDILTQTNRGESFIHTGERTSAGDEIDVLAKKFRDPVLSDLRVVFTSKTDAEIYPHLLKNLYLGESVKLVGRVRKGTSEVAFSLKGLNGAQSYEGFFRVKLAAASFDVTIPGEWRRLEKIARRVDR